MAASLPGDVSYHGNGTVQGDSQENPGDECRWYFSRKELEENSPSKRDGVDLKKETYLRKSYCTFLQDLGMRLKVPQVTIATAIIFCHRFFLHQSHAKNDRRTIATVCMFLAGKVEETPRPLKDVILISYEIIQKKDPVAVQRIKQKEVYEQQKELILLGERVVLATLGFDLNVHHPYKPLVEAIKKFKVAQNALAQVAWNFVNDGLRTSLCLQFRPHHIAAGAIFLAAKFLKVKLPTDGEKAWWQEFNVTPRQLEEVSNQMLELYEQNRVPPSNDVEETDGGGLATNSVTAKAPTNNDEIATMNSDSQTGVPSSRLEISKPAASKTVHESSAANQVRRAISNHNRSSDYGSTEMKHRAEDGAKCKQHPEWEPPPDWNNKPESQEVVKTGSAYGGEQDSNVKSSEVKAAAELREKQASKNLDHKDNSSGHPPQEAIKKIDRNKVKAALEKRRRVSGHLTRNPEIMDDDDLIERELEDGIELASQNEKSKQGKRQSWSKTSDRYEHENMHHGRHRDHVDEHYHGINGLASFDPDPSAVEEGELSALDDDLGPGLQSPKSINRKRRAGSSPDGSVEGKQHNFPPGAQNYNRFNYMEDRNKVGRFGQTERDSKRHIQENLV